MSGTNASENEFLGQINGAIEKNLSNSQFGVEELADAMNMSRSNLLRKLKKLTGLSVTQLISKMRLERAMDLLKNSSMNVTEVADQVGFGSTSYFIKVFRERYGYPPGETGKHDNDLIPQRVAGSGLPVRLLVGVGSLLIIALFAWIFWPSSKPSSKELSIAVLPFKNESSDSSNVYLINGLMESTLNNLQQIQDLKVISRTTSEKYRNTHKSIPEMAKELNVNYFIEGSGQKIGDNILLNIQLIEAATDKHVWAKQYRREAIDIFELQLEIAKNIADEIQVAITPEAERRIAKKPTKNLVAYDYFLKGKEIFYRSSRSDLFESLPYFQKAVEYDSTFALAYGTAAMVYYYIDIYQAVKSFPGALDSCTRKAMQYDPDLEESLVAKALSLATKKEYKEAVTYLEKAHSINPNSGLVVHFLTEFYSIHVFNTEKYLEYALKGVKIDQASPIDSMTTAFKYFHLGNAFVQGGFLDESLMYIDKSLEYFPRNPFAYVRVYVVFAKDRNVKRAREEMMKIFYKDTMRVDIMQEIAKLSYIDRDYKNAYTFYKKFYALQKVMNLEVYEFERHRMAVVCRELGYKKEAEQFIESFKAYAENDKSIYKHLNMAGYDLYTGDKDKAIAELRKFLDEDYNFQYWALLLETEPSFVDAMGDMPAFRAVAKEMNEKFWANNKRIRASMIEKGLL